MVQICTVLLATARDDLFNRLCCSYNAECILDTCFDGIYSGKNTHYSEIEMEPLFHILYFKDSNLLQRVGIFRVQPGILEVGLVENTRELGEL